MREVVEAAEYNILNSRYLDFAKKEQYETSFKEFYKETGGPEFAVYDDAVPNAGILNELAAHIQEGQSSEALQKLQVLVDNYQTELANSRPPPTEWIDPWGVCTSLPATPYLVVG